MPFACLAQPKNPAPPPLPIGRAEGERLGRALVANLLTQKPAQNSTNAAVVTIRGDDGRRRQIQARFAIVANPTNYLTIYETGISSNVLGGMTLTIVHADDRPNRYLLSEQPGPAASLPGSAPPKPRELSADQLMTPFAGSDFWLADLGLEFLHWPQQRVLRKEMRRSRACDVLESINPHPVAGGYARVLSWVGSSNPDDTVVVHADAFDDQDRVLKRFDPRKLEKVNGAYQLESMEMYNQKTGSRTVIEFDLKEK